MTKVISTWVWSHITPYVTDLFPFFSPIKAARESIQQHGRAVRKGECSSEKGVWFWVLGRCWLDGEAKVLRGRNLHEHRSNVKSDLCWAASQLETKTEWRKEQPVHFFFLPLCCLGPSHTKGDERGRIESYWTRASSRKGRELSSVEEIISRQYC